MTRANQDACFRHSLDLLIEHPYHLNYVSTRLMPRWGFSTRIKFNTGIPPFLSEKSLKHASSVPNVTNKKKNGYHYNVCVYLQALRYNLHFFSYFFISIFFFLVVLVWRYEKWHIILKRFSTIILQFHRKTVNRNNRFIIIIFATITHHTIITVFVIMKCRKIFKVKCACII